ncbi:hypothetical protein LLS1_06010 [Leifsonia sp. LS1]|uniref:ATP-binding cassette domain-containing protein n=1 Tax=Leifsonia sp. LS1 TaxID=2828483 RepID=UPI00208B698A|nr:ATP-binding cassette domain-containing protein [Leifsonia sp. LS1]GIT78932.1 hypothetical protein LLS1_06010 [Leifsonia sp. LS1]
MRVAVVEATVSFARRTVFDRLSADFPAREVSALVGPSGSGKSTLLASIAGFRTLTSGRIEIASATGVRTPHPRFVSWITQDVNILGARSALDNTMLGPLSEGLTFAPAAERARRALDDVGLGERSDEAARNLSGGERQRVAVARALASRRPLILADEPSAALDEDNTQQLAHLFARARGSATIIIATHDPVMIASASTVVTIRGTRS